MNRWLAGAGIAAALGLAGWAGYDRWGQPTRVAPVAPVPRSLSPTPGDGSEQPAGTGAPADVGVTPMRDRVAVIGLLNKRNGASQELRMTPGQALRVGDAIVRLRACEETAPWEQDRLTGAFVQLDVHGADRHWHRVFSGWLFKERPALNVVQDAVYDVWAKSCAMTLPATGPDTTVVTGDPTPGARSNRKKSPAAEGEPASAPEGATTPASADDNRDT